MFAPEPKTKVGLPAELIKDGVVGAANYIDLTDAMGVAIGKAKAFFWAIENDVRTSTPWPMTGMPQPPPPRPPLATGASAASSSAFVKGTTPLLIPPATCVRPSRSRSRGRESVHGFHR